MADFYPSSAMPGPSAVSTTNERSALLGPITWYLLKGIVVDSSASDATNSPTTELRHGLLLGKVTSTGRYQHYQPDGTTGVQLCEGFLWEARRTIDSEGNSVNRPAQMVIAGYVKADQLLLLDQQARGQMFGRFIFDDSLLGNSCGWRQVIAKTADYTVTTTDNNTIFTNKGAAGAVNFTLPTIAKGLRYRFFVEADQNVTVTAATADTLVVFNDAAADSIAFSTANEKVGGCIEVFSNSDASKWLVFVMLGAETQTPTIAT